MTGALTIGGTSASPSTAHRNADHATHETADYLHGYASWEEMEAAMNGSGDGVLGPDHQG